MRTFPRLAFLAALAALALLAGCRPSEEASPPAANGTSTATSPEDSLADREAELRAREAAVAQREAVVAEREGLEPPLAYSPEPPPFPARVEPPPRPRPAPAPRPAPLPEPAAVPQSAPAPIPEPQPLPEPEVRTVTVLVPAGSTFEVEFLNGLSSETSEVGQGFEARAVGDLTVGSEVAVPAGSTISGRVTEVRRGRKVGGRSLLALAFEELRLPSGEAFPIQAALASEGASDRRRDAATIGGSAAGGAILGHAVKDSDKGTVLGAILGAAIGTGIAAATDAQPVEIPAGTVVELALSEGLSVRRQVWD